MFIKVGGITSLGEISMGEGWKKHWGR